MATNTLNKQITIEGWRNVVVKLTGVLQVSDISETALLLTDCFNNDPRLTLIGFRVDIVEYSIGSGIEVQLQWNANTPVPMLPLSGRGRINAFNYGGLFPPLQQQTNGTYAYAQAGQDGSINLVTTGFSAQAVEAPQNFTVVLELCKLYR